MKNGSNSNNSNPYVVGVERIIIEIDTDSANTPITSKCCILKSKLPTENNMALAIIMDDPDAMAAVGKVWLHALYYANVKKPDSDRPPVIHGTNDFGEIGYGGPAPPDKRHTYIFKAYALDTELHLNNGFSKQELEDAMKGHILAEAKLTGTFAP